jgi:hypothetical protein
MSDNAVVWRKHPTSPKWHAFHGDGAPSACGLTNKAVGDPRPDVPPWPDACWRCCQELGVKTNGKRVPVDEEMEAEFIGGPLDGMRITLHVLREEPRLTVLARTYERQIKPVTRDA